MARKAFYVLLLASITALAASMWRDIVRYARIELMSRGEGHPEAVPAAGRHVYPNCPGDGVSDGTGDFDSASRGGPESA
jgi:hypothetical protein